MKISQREARRLRARVKALENRESLRLNCYASEYPGVYLGESETSQNVEVVSLARKLNHVVCVKVANNRVQFYAVPLTSN